MRNKERKQARLTNLQWLQTNAPWKYKEGKRSVSVRDPSCLLYDDTWMLTDCSLREAVTRLGPSGVSWPCALAWLCAREKKFVEEFDKACREQAPSLHAASTLLITRLSHRFRKPQLAVKQAVEIAQEQLSSVLISGAIKAEGGQAGSVQRVSIDPVDWIYFERHSDTAHDLFFDWHQNAVTFVDMRISDAALLRRWEERPFGATRKAP